MESDSDSDGSHISATPPREPKSRVPTPPPPPPPPRGPSILPSRTFRVRVDISSQTKSSSKPKQSVKLTKPSPETELNPSKQDRSTNPFPLPTPINLLNGPLLQNCRLSDQSRLVSVSKSIESLPAGYFSKLASFSKLQKPFLNLESVEQDSQKPGTEISQIDRLQGGSTQQGAGSEAGKIENSVKVINRHPNLIGGSIHPLPAKRPKCVGGAGNFVKLNINGHGRRFANKGRGNNRYTSSGRRYFKRSKRKLNAKSEAETDGLCDEDGLISEAPPLQQLKDCKALKFDCESIEEAALACRNDPSEENLMKLLKLAYGYDSFRDGQLEGIKMVLSGKSAMLVLPTGAGKSLCYQLAAMILPGLTLVISPLVALMIDQLKQLPPTIRGGMLSSIQTTDEIAETRGLLQEGSLKVLFVSPERFQNAEFISIFSSAPLISLVVVDEAHCISEWSHNFRPSYMRLKASVLRPRLNVKCILAMTATATRRTLNSIMGALEISPENIIQKSQLRENLQLSVSFSQNRMKDLMMLIKSSPFNEVQSIIIYCKFQFETDSISKFLCDNNISAKSYHSGLPAKDRTRTQDLFCSNKIRVVVATVAFGMGLDKRDIGAVIHYSLPESLEEYVQEIGRAGRDGSLSYCHLLFDDNTYFKLVSLMHSDGLDEYAVNRFLSEVFGDSIKSPGKIYSLVKESACRKFDMKEEVLLTILTQLELGEVQYLCLLPQMNVTCTLNFHQTSPVSLADKDTTVAAILKKSDIKNGQYVFDIPSLANSIGVTAVDLLAQLQYLKMKGEITYELKDPAYCYQIVNVPQDFCSLAAHLTTWLSEVELCKVRKFDAMFNTIVHAVKQCDKMYGCSMLQHTPCLQRKILDYFTEDDKIGEITNRIDQSSPFLRADIKVFLQSNMNAKFTPRAVARIMHGIPSPAYPSSVWSKTHFWGRYTQVDFQVVMKAAKAELMNIVGKDVI